MWANPNLCGSNIFAMMSSPLPLDPTLSLALAVHGTPGGYALLLGSGVSRAAGIPTGWEIMEDLIRRIATLEGPEATEGATADPAKWYATRFQVPITYSGLLDQLAATPAERRELLRAFFEPTAEERTEGLKSPTRAHRAIARMVSTGHFRVILTTNFDQLIETALRDEGIVPAVVSTPDGAQGMMPLHLAPVTVIKLHGDYLDTRLKNTSEELATYDPAINRLLDRILDEYGLVVCGWSATWDDALRAAMLRSNSRRFTTFWATRGDLSPEARVLTDHRRAQVLTIESADSFTQIVETKVLALTELARPHPLSAALAVATLKRYLPSPEHSIRLHDLVQDEVTRTIQRSVELIPAQTEPGSWSRVLGFLPKLEAATEILMALIATGGYWGNNQHRRVWVNALERLGNAGRQERRSGVFYPVWDKLYRYPAQLAFYAGGIAAVARGKEAEETLADLLLVPRLRTDARDEPSAPAWTLNLFAAVDHDGAKNLPGKESKLTPFSDYLFDTLRNTLRPLIPEERDYADLFDRFEYMVALAYAGLQLRATGSGSWAPVGRFAWRRRSYPPSTVVEDIRAEVDQEGSGWFLLRRGLFDGAPDKFGIAEKQIVSLLERRAFG